MNSRTKYGIFSLLLFILIWGGYIHFFSVPAFILPTPLSVFDTVAELLADPSFYGHVFYTLSEVLIGFFASVTFGLLIGFLININETIKSLSMPFLVFFQVIPKIAIVPLLIIWFGLGYYSKIFIVFIMSFFPIVEGTIQGLVSIPKERYELFDVLQSSRKDRLFKLELPSILPSLFPAMKNSIIQALIGATVAEWMSGQFGLGYLQTFASSTFDAPLLISGILFTILIGILLYGFITLLENKTLHQGEVEV